MSAINLAQPTPQLKIEYPETDGQPMAETDLHRDEMIDAIVTLKEHYRDNPRVYVAGNLLVYYEEGNPQKSVAPDVFAVLGVSNQRRRIYKIWEEGKAPDVVIEITSSSTRRQDREEKRLLYESLGVTEFFLFDPLGDYLKPPLRGFRLAGDYFVPLEPQPLGEGNWRLQSQVLNLELHTDGSHLRLFDPATKQYLLSPAEQAQARRTAEARAVRAEAEVERLKAELHRLQNRRDK